MKGAKNFIQYFFVAKVLVWFFDEQISDRKIDLSPISRVRTFPALFFTFERQGAQELWSKSFKWSRSFKKVVLPSGTIQQQLSFFWCHPIMDISRIHEKCANCVFLHSKSLQKILSNHSYPPFLWSEIHNCIINIWSEEVNSNCSDHFCLK